MVFSSVVFLVYFLPVALAAYYLFHKKEIRLQNAVLLVLSLLFYAWGEPYFILLLLFSGFLHWAMARQMEKRPGKKKLFLIIACVFDVGALFLFKYWNFMADTINTLAKITLVPEHDWALPLGISFYTFQALSYIIDVYMGRTPAAKKPWEVLLYLAMFPQIMSGPIVRYHTIVDQLNHRELSWSKFSEGCARLVQGLAKKLILASAFAGIADNIFSLTRAGHTVMLIPISLAWLGSFAYTLQIYLDFSSYSDMAIGVAKMFGFTFEENFRYPYLSKSIGEFWRRWHISLGTWFREYIYFPLGGSRMESIDGTLRNMLVVWLLTGLWHGASWTFLLWGVVNFLFIALERISLLEKRAGNGLWRNIYTMVVINLSWVLFRCEDFYQVGEYFGNLFGTFRNPFYSPYVPMFLREYWLHWIAALLVCVPTGPALRSWIKNKSPKLDAVLYPAGMMLLLLVSAVYLYKSGYTTFIYSNF